MLFVIVLSSMVMLTCAERSAVRCINGYRCKDTIYDIGVAQPEDQKLPSIYNQERPNNGYLREPRDMYRTHNPDLIVIGGPTSPPPTRDPKQPATYPTPYNMSNVKRKDDSQQSRFTPSVYDDLMQSDQYEYRLLPYILV